jgi:hypothetical protein
MVPFCDTILLNGVFNGLVTCLGDKKLKLDPNPSFGLVNDISTLLEIPVFGDLDTLLRVKHFSGVRNTPHSLADDLGDSMELSILWHLTMSCPTGLSASLQGRDEGSKGKLLRKGIASPLPLFIFLRFLSAALAIPAPVRWKELLKLVFEVLLSATSSFEL